ncbi:hypothetical protein KIN20_008618 [Parelaphostrongylus tenuis]|uniref:Uncharacterized protein n=1 Tax=Parelaphostrongylus tenuis TaxID=148309 RepID=A0AAD5M9Z0_PARTN|nr:hypothetical protein KIN20_008618 [Parelaphostrongylus tenuis]
MCLANQPLVQLRSCSSTPHHGSTFRLYTGSSSLEERELIRDRKYDAHEQHVAWESQRAVSSNEAYERERNSGCEQIRHDSNKLYQAIPRVHCDHVESSNSVNYMHDDNEFHAYLYKTRNRTLLELTNPATDDHEPHQHLHSIDLMMNGRTSPSLLSRRC